MAFTNFLYFDQTTLGLPCRNVNGDLTAILDAALRTATGAPAWTRPYNDGLSPILKANYAPPGGGVILSVNHNSAVSGDGARAIVRGAESQSAGTLTDPFPQTGQVGDTSCNWGTSSTSTSRDYFGIAYETGIFFASKTTGIVDAWELSFFAKCPSRIAGDNTYNWVASNRNNAGISVSRFASQGTTMGLSVSGNGYEFFMRHPAGAVKSPWTTFNTTGPNISSISSAPQAGAAYGGSIDMEACYISDNHASTNAIGGTPILRRVVVPHLFNLVATGLTGVTETDTFQETVGAVTHTYRLIRPIGMLLISNTWVPPSRYS